MISRLPIDNGSPRASWDAQHKKIASEPIAWVATADELLRAFQLLAQQTEEDFLQNREGNNYVPIVSNVSIMLGALAIENLLKAVCIKKTSNPIFDNKGAFALRTHNLLWLAEDACVSLSPTENILLERLEQFLSWGGRYPIPVSFEAMCPRTLPTGGFAPLTSYLLPTVFQEILAFSERIKAMLPTVTYLYSES